MAKTFTKVDFAQSVIALMNDEVELTAELRANMLVKAEALLQSELNRKAYAEAHPSAKASKVSEKTKALAEAMAKVLTAEPMTSNEIAIAIGQPELTPLNISNAIKYVAGVEKTKKKVMTTKKDGCKAEALHTAYFIK